MLNEWSMLEAHRSIPTIQHSSFKILSIASRLTPNVLTLQPLPLTPFTPLSLYSSSSPVPPARIQASSPYLPMFV
jgi:hypothetical protein